MVGRPRLSDEEAFLRELARKESRKASDEKYYSVHKEEIKQKDLENQDKNRQYWRQYDANRRESDKAYERARDTKAKLTVMERYGKEGAKCCSCGFSDIRALSIDHIDGTGSKHRRETGLVGVELYRWLIKNNFPEGYQTLCMNCQWVKRSINKELKKLD